MCGIVGYTGKELALAPVLEGLRKLEYRGYDSAGIALITDAGEKLWIEKRAGKLGNLEEVLAIKFQNLTAESVTPDGPLMADLQMRMHIHI